MALRAEHIVITTAFPSPLATRDMLIVDADAIDTSNDDDFNTTIGVISRIAAHELKDNLNFKVIIVERIGKKRATHITNALLRITST